MLLHLVLAAALSSSSAQGSHGGYGMHGGHGMSGAQPMYVNAAVSGDGTKLKIQVFMVKYAEEHRTRTKRIKDENGKVREVTETYNVMVPVPVAREIEQELDKVQGLDHEGQKLNAKTLASRLAKMTPVLATYDQEGLDPGYYRILRPGATVVVFPPVRPMAPKGESPKVSVQLEPEFIVAAGEKKEEERGRTKPPLGQPPTLSGASIDDKDILHLQDSAKKNFDQEVEVMEKVKVGDAWEERKVKVKIKNTSFTVNKTSMPAMHVRAHDLNGKAIDAKALASRLRKFTMVLESIDGKNVDPYYLQLFKEGTIVLVPPMLGHYGGGTVVTPARAEKNYPAPKKESKAPPVKNGA